MTEPRAADLAAQATADAAIANILRIHDAAAGRELTSAQSRDLAQYRNELSVALEAQPGATAYTRALIDDWRTREMPREAEAEVLREIHKVQNFEELRQAGDAFRRLAAPVIERSSGGNHIDFRTLIRCAYNGNGAALDITVSYDTRALQSAGGSAIASEFSDQLIAYQRTFSPLIDPGIVRIVSRTDGSPYIQPRLTADAAAGGTTTAEAGNVTLLDPTISSVTITPAKRAAITVVSSELWEDNDVDLQSLVVESTGRSIGIALGTALTATLLSGIANGGTATGTANNTFWGPADLASLYTSVAAPYRSTGTWLVSTDALAKLYKLQDSAGNPVLFQMSGGEAPRLFGRPVVEDPGLAAVGSASKSVVFGDLRQAMTVVRRSPIRVEISTHAYFGTDQVGVRVVDRSAGAVIDAVAAAYLVSANA